MKVPLMIVSIVTLLFSIFLTFSTPGFAQEDKIEPEPIPIPPKYIDLNGTWNYKTTKPTVSGKCPAGVAMAGTAIFIQKGKDVTLKYVSGAKCEPAAVCIYTGVLNENNLLLSNSVEVDDEGGEVNSAVSITVFNNELGKGTGTNHYIHPKGFECRWNMNVVFTRKLENKTKKQD
jgi:hypothetical protein